MPQTVCLESHKTQMNQNNHPIQKSIKTWELNSEKHMHLSVHRFMLMCKSAMHSVRYPQPTLTVCDPESQTVRSGSFIFLFVLCAETSVSTATEMSSTLSMIYP